MHLLLCRRPTKFSATVSIRRLWTIKQIKLNKAELTSGYYIDKTDLLQ